MIRDQASSRPQKKKDFIPTSLNELDRAGVCDALGRFSVDFHDLVAHLDRGHPQEQRGTACLLSVLLLSALEPLRVAERLSDV